MNKQKQMSGFLIFLAFSGCGFMSKDWPGSVDSVFKYQSREKVTLIHDVLPGTMSSGVGLKKGDVLIEVDGFSVTGASFEKVRSALAGPVGTYAKILVLRGNTQLSFSVERKQAKTKAAKTPTEVMPDNG